MAAVVKPFKMEWGCVRVFRRMFQMKTLKLTRMQLVSVRCPTCGVAAGNPCKIRTGGFPVYATSRPGVCGVRGCGKEKGSDARIETTSYKPYTLLCIGLNSIVYQVS
jgi:hypothetical protein